MEERVVTSNFRPNISIQTIMHSVTKSQKNSYYWADSSTHLTSFRQVEKLAHCNLEINKLVKIWLLKYLFCCTKLYLDNISHTEFQILS